MAEPELTLPALNVLRIRVTLRLTAPARLPPFKGALLRGGLGYALQRISCPQQCWGQSNTCPAALPHCVYRDLFEPTPPPNSEFLHDLRDAPRPFVIEPPLDQRRMYQAGDLLETNMLLFGRGIDFLPFVALAFADFAQAGLGRYHTTARLERIEALPYGQLLGMTIYRDGDDDLSLSELPVFNLSELTPIAHRLPSDLRLALRTPLRIKSRGELMQKPAIPAIVQATAWRLQALNHFYGNVPWEVDYRPAIAAAQQVTVEDDTTRWVDWERSSTRPSKRQSMVLGGLVGAATLRNVPPVVRAFLLAANLVHTGKSCVFGHGWIEVRSLR